MNLPTSLLAILAAISLVDAKPAKKQAMYAARYPRIGRMMVDEPKPEVLRRIQRQQTVTVTVPIRTITDTITTTNYFEATSLVEKVLTETVTLPTTVFSTAWETVTETPVETVTSTAEDDSPRSTTVVVEDAVTFDPTTVTETQTITEERTAFVDRYIIQTADSTTTLTLPSTATDYHIETVWETLYGEVVTETVLQTTTGTVTDTVSVEQTHYVTETDYTETITQYVTSTLAM